MEHTKNTSNTKNKLVSNITVLFVCFAMLVATTYAWFTDSASTGVNKIQAGNLDIQLLDENGNSIEGDTLNWVKADGSTDVLWEPGATYYTQGFKIKNAGNLALKFKITINGVTGNTGLLNAIDFYLTSDKSKNLEVTNAVSAFDSEYHLAAGKFWKVNSSATSDVIYLAGHMDENAGNEYQGLSLDNIGITLAATQDTVESDSFDKFYDEFATYPVVPTLNNYSKTGNVSKTDGGTLGSDTDPAKISIPQNAISTDSTTAKFSMTLTETKPDSVTYDISLKELSSNGVESDLTLSNPATVTADIGKNLKNVKVLHNTTPMTIATGSNDEGRDGYYKYDSNTGVVTIWTSSFSPFTFTYDYDGVCSLNGELYPSLETATSVVQNGETITLVKDTSINLSVLSFGDSGLGNSVKTDVVLNLNGHTLSNIYNSNATLKNGSSLIIKDGKMNFRVENGALSVLSAETNSSITLNNVEYETTGAALFPRGDAAKVEVNDSTIKAKTYCFGTNASSAENYNIIIKINNSKLSSWTAGIINVPGILEINNSTLTGEMHGLVVRGGTATIKDSQIINNGEVSEFMLNYFNSSPWADGNTVNLAALTFGNKHNAYQYPTTVTVKNTVIKSESYRQEKSYPAIYGYGNTGEGLGATLTYDDDCTITGDVILGNNAASINGAAGPAN